MVTSRYIQLNDWLLLEYSYTANAPTSLNYPTVPETVGDTYAGIYRITNSFTNEYQFVNQGAPVNGMHITGNCLDWTALPVNAQQTKWALSTIGSGENVFTQHPEIVLEDYNSRISNVSYDTLKMHVLSGYNFEGIDGFVLEVFFKENSKSNLKVATFCFSADLQTQTPVFNPSPVMLSEKMYDKYLTFSMPSLEFIQTEYWQNPDNATGFEYNYTHPTIAQNTNPGGIVKDSPIFFTLHELVNVETINDVDYFDVRNQVTASVLCTDNFSNLQCVVKEGADGDYFEYYPTWQGTFIDNYINNLNSTGNNDWTVVNEIRVLEQVGVDVNQTAQITQVQNENYDTPNYFRPIIKNAATAFSFTIYYVMKFFNRATSEQIIRTASLTSLEPSKYGKGLMKINIDVSIKPLKVYNKVINLKRLQGTTAAVSKPMPVSTKYVDVYTDRYNVALNVETSEVKDTKIFYGQGEVTIYISKFDNVIQFAIVSLVNGSYIPKNITNLNLFLNIILDNGQVLSFPMEKTNGQNGECKALIKREDSQKILKQIKEKSFYIVSVADSSSLETLIYHGKFKDSNEYNPLDANQPFIDFMKEWEARLNAMKLLLASEYSKLEQDRFMLAKQSAELQKQLTAILNAISLLSASQQQAIKNALPSTIAQVSTSTLTNGIAISKDPAIITGGTGNGSSSSANQTVVDDTNKINKTIVPPGGNNTGNNDNGSNIGTSGANATTNGTATDSSTGCGK
ncbi:MAG: hypothetical protein WC979_01510 [Candidatus Pacearchaeota archaeon]|jgi:hypothetical protein|nr:hypothetical protein [Clostridia bacterium]